MHLNPIWGSLIIFTLDRVYVFFDSLSVHIVIFRNHYKLLMLLLKISELLFVIFDLRLGLFKSFFHIEQLLICRIKVGHHGGHLLASDVRAGALVSVLLQTSLHPHHLHLYRLIVQLELLVELFGVSKVLFVLLQSGSKLLEVERVLKLLLSLEHFSILGL